MFAFMQVTAGIVAIFSLSHLQRRSQLILSIFLIFITYTLVYMAFILTQEGEIRGTHLFALIWLAINCLLLTLTYPVIYIFERIFGYTSEITLIELSNPNHPALRNLTKKAPGTFQHSLMVANLAEEAIYRIGGNPLLTRTGALYHDIGKTFDPIFLSKIKAGESTHTTSVNSMSVPSTSSTMSVKESKWPRSIICPKVLSTLSVPITEKQGKILLQFF